MMRVESPIDDCIVAVATGRTAAPLAVIRLDGSGAVARFSGCCDRSDRVLSAKGHTIVHAWMCDAAGRRVDEVLVSVFRAPHSYTGNEALEIGCHGGVAVVDSLVRILVKAGFRPANPGEFTLRAFVGGKIDLTRAEAVHDIVAATTAVGHGLAVHRLEGRLEARINQTKEQVARLMAWLSVLLDYPESEVPDAVAGLASPETDATVRRICAELDQLAASYQVSRLFADGVRVAIAGRTNAGKSSLFNALMREDRSIVSDVAGTTRDYIEVRVTMDGLPVALFDTAGFREHRRTAGEDAGHDDIELEGMRRSSLVVRAAQVVLYLVDAAVGFRPEDEDLMATLGLTADTATHAGDATPVVIPVLTKCDLVGRPAVAAEAVAAGAVAAGAVAAGAVAAEAVAAEAVAAEAVAAEAVAAARSQFFGTTTSVAPIAVSVVDGSGLCDLTQAIIANVPQAAVGLEHQLVVGSQRQQALLVQAAAALNRFAEGLAWHEAYDLMAEDVQEALDCLGEITGEVTRDDVLDIVFGRFCVGK